MKKSMLHVILGGAALQRCDKQVAFTSSFTGLQKNSDFTRKREGHEFTLAATSLKICPRFSAGGVLSAASAICFSAHSLTSAAKAAAENEPVIAALKRCATQSRVQNRVFPQAACGGEGAPTTAAGPGGAIRKLLP